LHSYQNLYLYKKKINMNLIIIVHNQLVVLSLTSVTLVLIYVHTRISVQWDLRDLRKLVSLRYLMQTTCRKDLKNIMFYHTINIVNTSLYCQEKHRKDLVCVQWTLPNVC